MNRIAVYLVALVALLPLDARAQHTSSPTAGSSTKFRVEGGFTSPIGTPVPLGSEANVDTFSPFTTTAGDLHLGLDLGGFTPLVGLGLNVTSLSSSQSQDGGATVGHRQTVYTAVLSLQLRYYFSRAAPGLQPFVWGEFQKSFLWGSVSVNGPDTDAAPAQKALDDALKGLNPLGVLAGFGAEYDFGPSFGVGGRWGFGWFKVSRTETADDLGPGVTGKDTADLVRSDAELFAAFRF